jgi:hypothetical protein
LEYTYRKLDIQNKLILIFLSKLKQVLARSIIFFEFFSALLWNKLKVLYTCGCDSSFEIVDVGVAFWVPTRRIVNIDSEVLIIPLASFWKLRAIFSVPIILF